MVKNVLVISEDLYECLARFLRPRCLKGQLAQLTFQKIVFRIIHFVTVIITLSYIESKGSKIFYKLQLYVPRRKKFAYKIWVKPRIKLHDV